MPVDPLPPDPLRESSPVADAAAPREVRTDDAGRLAENVACRKCGYDLMGLPTSGRCPECGSSVGWSIHGDLLQYSDPAWVDTLANGAWWMIIGLFAGIGGGIIGAIVDAIEGIEAAAPVLGTVAAAIGLVGYWKLTMPDPGHVTSEQPWNIRRATRILAVTGFLAGLAALAAVHPDLSAGSVEIALVVLSAALQLAGVVGSLLLFILLRRLADRIPNPRLAKQTHTVMWGFTVCYGLMIVLGAIIALAVGFGVFGGGMTAQPRGALGVVFAVAGVSMCGVVVGVLVFTVWWVVLLFWYRRALVKSSKIAMDTWMREGA